MMDVSVIIVNYNTPDLTRQCIDSIERHTSGVQFEIIVVDNASADGSTEMLSQDKRITCIQSDTNLGFGRANNLGMSRAKGKYIFFLNSDTILLNNALKMFYDYCENADSKTGAVGCYLEKPDGKRAHSFGCLPTFKSLILPRLVMHFNLEKGKSYAGHDKAERILPEGVETGYVTGADIFVNRSVIYDCGGFDPDFFMYYEESEMQHRFKKKGYVNKVIDGPRIVHLEGMSQQKSTVGPVAMRKMVQDLTSRTLYMRKTTSAAEYSLYRIVNTIVELPFAFLSRKYPWSQRKVYLKTLFS